MILSDYITDLRFILEEFPSPGITWTDSQLTLCINKARDRVSLNTKCCRGQATLAAGQGQIVYPYSSVLSALLTSQPPFVGGPSAAPPARSVSHVYNVNFQWSPSFQPVLRRYPWSTLNAYFLSNPSIQSITLAWGQYDLQSFYVWPPAPSGTYTIIIDCIYLPTYLVNTNDQDTAIPELVGRALVPLMSARWALYYLRDYVAAQQFQQQYEIEKAEIMASLPSFAIESFYDEEG